MRWGAVVLSLITLSAILPVAPASAQEEGELTSPSAFREDAVGKTFSYRLTEGEIWGREFWPNADVTIWQNPDGSCLTCDVERVGDQLCFSCQDGSQSCWRHFELEDGRVRIVSEALGEAIGRNLGNRPLACGVPNS